MDASGSHPLRSGESGLAAERQAFRADKYGPRYSDTTGKLPKLPK